MPVPSRSTLTRFLNNLELASALQRANKRCMIHKHRPAYPILMEENSPLLDIVSKLSARLAVSNHEVNELQFDNKND